MNKLFLFAILLCVFSCNDNNKNKDCELNGFKGFSIGVTKLVDIIDEFGINYKMDTMFLQIAYEDEYKRLDSCVLSDSIFTFKYYYDSIGLCFYFKSDTGTVYAVSMNPPYEAFTKNGIILNKSTFKDVEEKYGKAQWFFTDDYIFKEYEGISFEGIFIDTLPITKKDLKPYLDEKITEITINYGRISDYIE